MSDRLSSRLGHIAELVCLLHDMETGRDPLDPLRYHALALRLRKALSDVPDVALNPVFAELPCSARPVLAEALQNRHFAWHCRWGGSVGTSCEAQAHALWARLQRG
jgi:hypothetical protein